MTAEVNVVHLLEAGARLLLRRLRLRNVPVPLPRLVEVLVRAFVIRQTSVDVNSLTYKASLPPSCSHGRLSSMIRTSVSGRGDPLPPRCPSCGTAARPRA